MTSDELNDALRDCKHAGTRLRLREHLAAVESEHRALVADNAALREALTAQLHNPFGVGVGARSAAILGTPHPGAALLSELHDMRARVEMMGRASWYADFQQEQAKRLAAERERDEARAQVATARAAALEEAARVIDLAGAECSGASRRRLSDRIRALATTPPPSVVPVAKVREVLKRIHSEAWEGIRSVLHVEGEEARKRQAHCGGHANACLAVARDLGINLDGEP